jgi:hypothetical protein
VVSSAESPDEAGVEDREEEADAVAADDVGRADRGCGGGKVRARETNEDEVYDGRGDDGVPVSRIVSRGQLGHTWLPHRYNTCATRVVHGDEPFIDVEDLHTHNAHQENYDRGDDDAHDHRHSPSRDCAQDLPGDQRRQQPIAQGSDQLQERAQLRGPPSKHISQDDERSVSAFGADAGDVGGAERARDVGQKADQRRVLEGETEHLWAQNPHHGVAGDEIDREPGDADLDDVGRR